MSENNINLESEFRQRWKQYQHRFGIVVDADLNSPKPDLGMIVVIPCYDEPDLLNTLESLYYCERPACSVEILLIINASDADDEAVHRQNRQTYEEVKAWAERLFNDWFSVYVYMDNNISEKLCGVGYARKIGLDLAVSRFAQRDREQGICLSLDADCLVEKNYLTTVYEHFIAYAEYPLAVINFAHRIEEVEQGQHKAAIIAYETHLRYYVQGIRYAGLPYAFHTLGSCFAVTAFGYMQQGGMNKRQGGEDFYFIHKFSALNLCSRIISTSVLPSARISQRVPFGTGPTLSRWQNENKTDFVSYHPQVFRDLLSLSKAVNRIESKSQIAMFIQAGLPLSLVEYLKQLNIQARLNEFDKHTASIDAFKQRFWQWFNAFIVMKYIHFAHEHYYQRIPLSDAINELFYQQKISNEDETDLSNALRFLRLRDAENGVI